VHRERHVQLERHHVLGALERALAESGVATQDALAAIRIEVQDTVREASERAQAWREPGVETRFEDVFA